MESEACVYQKRENEVETSLQFSPPPMKKLETRDSISSVDSDVSLSFDRRGSKGEEADLSDYECEVKTAKILDRDSGADSAVDDVTTITTTELKNQQVSAERGTDDFVAPDDELAEKICAQVEFYFSNENIAKDAFLLKHVRRNKEGYVSLKLISSFKKVKHLSKDWRVIGAALTAKSKQLEINSQGTKLRRINPPPLVERATSSSRTIIAAGLPIEKLTVESVAEIFKSCGEIALIRVLRPGHPAPFEVQQAISKRAELTCSYSKEFAMVEFTDSASTRNAMQLVLGDAKIFELHRSVDKRKKHQPIKKNTFNRVTRADNYNSSSCPSGSETEDGKLRHKSDQRYQMCSMSKAYSFQAEPPSPDAWLSRKLSSCSVSNSENGFIYRRLSSCSGSSSDTDRRYSTCSSGSDTTFFHPNYTNNFYHHENRRYCCCFTGSITECEANCHVAARRRSAEYSSFLRRSSTCNHDSGYDIKNIRRLSLCPANSEHDGFCRSRGNSGIAIAHLPVNVTRMPSGPDGTRGFFSRSAKTPLTIEPTC